MSLNRFLRKLVPAKKPPEQDTKIILIVDDDEGLRDGLKDILESEGYETCSAGSKREAVKVAGEKFPMLALVDLKLPDGSGTALLSDLKNIQQDCVCILMTAFADVDSAILALEKGAFYYLRKPVKPAELIELVDLAFETIRLRRDKRIAEEALMNRNKELEEIIARLRKIID
jgi:DNA-binding NtrC family response regulator